MSSLTHKGFAARIEFDADDGLLVGRVAGINDIVGFHGVKIALLLGDEVLTYLRDDKPKIPWPAHWDLPGGGREGNETPTACVIREIAEEFEFDLDASQIIYTQTHAAIHDGAAPSIFMVGNVTSNQIKSIQFGSEGQRWEMMNTTTFVNHARAVESLKNRLRDYLQAVPNLSPAWRKL
jgi:8-oxo-dGTP diphosphatase